MNDWKKLLADCVEKSKNKDIFIQEVKDYIYNKLSDRITQPVDNVQWIPLDKVQANNYNPNSVATTEMHLLYLSIKSDGFTQPVVVIKNHKYFVKILDTLLYLQDDNLDQEIWTYLENLSKQSLLIQQVLLMQTGVSTLIEKQIDTLSEHSNQKKTMGELYLKNSEMDGESVEFTLITIPTVTKDFQECFVGPLQGWKSVTTLHVLSININSSKEKDQNKLLNTINLFLPIDSIMGNGMMLRINFLEKIGNINQIGSFLKQLTEVLMQSEQDGHILGCSVQDESKYVIVDGFHRYTVMRTREDIRELNRGMLPCVVIKKSINERMASTVRHNRARGKHSIGGMANMVFKMLEEGWSEEHICNELGMETEEIVRLKYITGFAKLFENVEYKKAWETRSQIKIRLEEELKQNKNE